MFDSGGVPETPTRRTPLVRLMIAEVDGAWRLFMDGERVGRFGARRDALGCVHDMAGEMRAAGMEVEVLAQSEAGDLTVAEDPSWRSRRHLTLVKS